MNSNLTISLQLLKTGESGYCLSVSSYFETTQYIENGVSDLTGPYSEGYFEVTCFVESLSPRIWSPSNIRSMPGTEVVVHILDLPNLEFTPAFDRIKVNIATQSTLLGSEFISVNDAVTAEGGTQKGQGESDYDSRPIKSWRT